MQEGRPLSATQVNRDLLRSILETPKWFWTAVGVVVVGSAGTAIGLAASEGKPSPYFKVQAALP